MIESVLGNPKSCSGPFLYSARKVQNGTATVIGVKNIRSAELADIKYAFRSRETNPIIHPKARNLGYHIAISPGPGEQMSNVQAYALANELMTQLGFGGQPWVIIRHNDIEREHYHIITTKAKTDGHVISDSFSGYEAMEILKKLAPKYGYVYGRDPNRQDQKIRVDRFNPKKGDIAGQFLCLHRKAVGYTYSTLEEYKAVMASLGVRVTDTALTQGLVFQGIDRAGKPTTSLFANQDYNGLLMMEAELNCKETSLNNNNLGEYAYLIQEAVESTGSEKEFLTRLHDRGLDCSLRKDKEGIITDAFFIDHKNRQTFHSDQLGEDVKIEFLNEMYNNGSWDEPQQPNNDQHIEDDLTIDIDDFLQIINSTRRGRSMEKDLPQKRRKKRK